MFGDAVRGGDRESDEEDDYFKPVASSSGKSGLAKLFGLAPKATVTSGERSGAAPKQVKISERYGPSSFRYIPAEPGVDEPTEETNKPPEWSIVRATVVTAYKLVETDNVFQGKVGLALLKSTSGHRLLLYRTKTDVLGTVTLNRDMKVFLKQDYVQFRTDDSSDFWSVLFETEPDRQAMLAVVESRCCVEREPVVEEPLSEVERDPEPSKNSRSELAARMARMGGQAMPLPERAKAPPIPKTAPGSDSSDTSDSKIETISTRPIRRANVLPAVGMQMVPLAGMVPSGAGSGASLGPGQGTSTMADVNFNLVMSENRMQNTEMRMNLTKLESKLDRVLDRIDLLNVHGAQGGDRPSADKDAELLELEEKLLELKRANHALKAKVRTLEESELGKRLEADAKLKEKLQTAEESQRRLQADVVTLQHKLEMCCTEVEALKESVAVAEKQRAEAKQETERKAKEVEEAVKQLTDAQHDRDRLKEDLTRESVRSAELTGQVEQLRKECESLQRAPSQPVTSNATLVKEIMNGCYQRLCEQITDPQVLKIIAQTIKRETKAALERDNGQ